MKSVILFISFLSNLCSLVAQSWIREADFAGDTRLNQIGFCVGNKCYMGTGVNGTGSPSGGPPLFKDFWEWDPATNTWTQKADFGGGGRSNAVAFAIGNKGYIATGENNSNAYNDLWEYNPINNSWAQMASLPAAARANAVAFTIGTKAYIATGGTYQGNILQDLWEWDQPTNTWTRKADYPGGPRMNAMAFSIGNKGYIGTGQDMNYLYKDFWEWDQTTDTWTRKGDFPYLTYFLSGFSIGNIGYSGVCGKDTSIWEWNQTTNTWNLGIHFPGTPGNICFSNGTKGYAGMGGEYWQTDFWEFDPVGSTTIKEETVNSSLQVFPNPVGSSSFTTKYTINTGDKLFLSVKNSLGQTVYTDSDAHFSGTYNKVIDLGTNTKGIYFVEIICGKDHQINKIVLE